MFGPLEELGAAPLDELLDKVGTLRLGKGFVLSEEPSLLGEDFPLTNSDVLLVELLDYLFLVEDLTSVELFDFPETLVEEDDDIDRLEVILIISSGFDLFCFSCLDFLARFFSALDTSDSVALLATWRFSRLISCS